MTTATTDSSRSTSTRSPTGVVVAVGALMLLLGIIGLGATFALTLTTAVFFGVLLTIGGVAGVVRAIQGDTGGAKVWHVLLGLAYVFAGVVAITHPMFASVALTLWIAIALLVGGVFQLLIAFGGKLAGPARMWTALSGVASLILGGIIWSEWPESSMWVIGLFISIQLIVQGWAWLMGGMALRGQ